MKTAVISVLAALASSSLAAPLDARNYATQAAPTSTTQSTQNYPTQVVSTSTTQANQEYPTQAVSTSTTQANQEYPTQAVSTSTTPANQGYATQANQGYATQAASTFVTQAESTFVTGAAPTYTLQPSASYPTSSGSGSAVQPNPAYKCYSGNGSPAAGWPTSQQWISFEQMWTANQGTLAQSCAWNNWGANNSPAEIASLKSAILSVSKAEKVDPRVVFATVMQESEGCVRVPTTNNGVSNPGLMQSHSGSGTCAGVSPCPATQITQMIHDGVAGTAAGPGLVALFQQAQPHTDQCLAQVSYIAVRLYNSGSADYANLNNGMSSTAGYVNDIANRLTGWTTGTKSCTPA